MRQRVDRHDRHGRDLAKAFVQLHDVPALHRGSWQLAPNEADSAPGQGRERTRDAAARSREPSAATDIARCRQKRWSVSCSSAQSIDR